MRRDTLELRGTDWPGMLALLVPPDQAPLDPGWVSGQLRADRLFVRRYHAQAAAPVRFTGTLYRRTSPRP